MPVVPIVLRLALGWAAPTPSTSAPALEPELQLSWVAPAGCPDEATVRDRVTQLLRRPLTEAAQGSALHVSAQAQPRDGGWSVEVRIGDEARHRSRTMTGPSCDTLAETVALIAAISLDPGVDPRAVPAPRAEPTKPTPKPHPQPAPPHAPATIPDPPPNETPLGLAAPLRTPRMRVGLRLAASGAVGVTSRIAPGVTGAASVLWPRWRLVGRFDHWFARSIQASGGEGGARISLSTGGVRGCLAPAVDIFEFPVCAGAVAGVMRGDGEDLSVPLRARLPFVAADIGPGLNIVPRGLGGIFAVVLAIDLVVPVLRPGFEVDDLGEISRVFPVLGRATVGVELRIPRTEQSK